MTEIAHDMRKMAQEIVSSYQARISEVVAIVDDTHQLLDDLRDNRDQMVDTLKETLAREGSLRRKDFDNIMQNISSRQDEREKEVRELLKTFFEEQKEIAEIVKKNLDEGEQVRIDKFKKMLEDIQVRQRSREEEVKKALTGFQTEYKEMSGSLRSLLDKGEEVRIRDFKEMVGSIRTRQTARANETGSGFDEIKKERQNMSSQWREASSIMAKKRADGPKGGEGRERGKAARV